MRCGVNRTRPVWRGRSRPRTEFRRCWPSRCSRPRPSPRLFPSGNGCDYNCLPFIYHLPGRERPKARPAYFKRLLSGGAHMSTAIAEMPGVLRINDTAPDFTAETTQGTIRFHEWIGNGWAILFSHPTDFTPVCTTELGYMAGLQPEFAKRNCKIIGLSVDPVSDHGRWAADIEETQGHKVNYPMIGDPELTIAKLYNMLPASSGP